MFRSSNSSNFSDKKKGANPAHPHPYAAQVMSLVTVLASLAQRIPPPKVERKDSESAGRGRHGRRETLRDTMGCGNG